MKKSVLDTYYLKDDTRQGKSFVITYEDDTEEDQEGDAIQIKIIIGLEFKA